MSSYQTDFTTLKQQLNKVNHDFCFLMIKKYLAIHENLFTRELNDYQFTSSTLNITEYHLDFELIFKLNDGYHTKKVILNNAHVINENLIPIIGQSSFNELSDFYNNVLTIKEPYFKTAILNYFKSINLKVINYDRDEFNNKEILIEKLFTPQLLIEYEKEIIEAITPSIASSQSKSNKIKL
jgi:hypothetical protein